VRPNAEKATVKLPDWIKDRVRSSGEYLVPLRKGRKSYATFGSYQFPKYDEKTLEALLKQIQLFKTLAPDKEADFLKKMVAENASAWSVQAALSRLVTIGYFKHHLSGEELAFWQNFIADSKVRHEFREWVLRRLDQYNGSSLKPFLPKLLQDKELGYTAAAMIARQDSAKFSKQMYKWLEDEKTRSLALRYGGFMAKDKAFVAAAMQHFNKSPEGVKEYMGLLLLPENTAGNAVIRELLKNKPEEYKQLIPQIYMRIIRSRNPEWKNEVLELVRAKSDKRSEVFLRPLALAYLCGMKNAEGIALTEKALVEWKDNRQQQLRLIMAFRMMSRQPLKTVDELKKLLAAIKSGGQADAFGRFTTTKPAITKTAKNINK
jgi:hypothetical protein